MLNKKSLISFFSISLIIIISLGTYNLLFPKAEEIFSSAFDVFENNQHNYSSQTQLSFSSKNEISPFTLDLKLDNSHTYFNQQILSLYNFEINGQKSNQPINAALQISGKYLIDSLNITHNLFQIEQLKGDLNKFNNLKSSLNIIQDNWFQVKLPPKNKLLNLKELIFNRKYLINTRSKEQLITSLDLTSCSSLFSPNYCLNFTLDPVSFKNVYIKNFYDQRRPMSLAENKLIEDFLQLATIKWQLIVHKKDYSINNFHLEIITPFLNSEQQTSFNWSSNPTVKKPSPLEIIDLSKFITKAKPNFQDSSSGSILTAKQEKELNKNVDNQLEQTPITGSGGILNKEIKELDRKLTKEQQSLLDEHQLMIEQYLQNYEQQQQQQDDLYQKNNQLFQEKIKKINEEKASWQEELSNKISNWLFPKAYAATVGEDIRSFPFSFNNFDNGEGVFIANPFYKDTMKIYVNTFVVDSYMLRVSFKSNFAYNTISYCEDIRIRNLQELTIEYLQQFRDIVKNAHCPENDDDCSPTELISGAIDGFLASETGKRSLFFGELINDNDNTKDDEIINFIFDNDSEDTKEEFDIEWFYELWQSIPDNVGSDIDSNSKYHFFKEYVETATNYIAYTGSISIRKFAEQNYKKNTPQGDATVEGDKEKIFYCGNTSRLEEKYEDTFDFIPWKDITHINCEDPAYLLYAHRQSGTNIANDDDLIKKENFVGLCLEETLTLTDFANMMLEQIQVITGTVSIIREWFASIASLFNEAMGQVRNMWRAAFDDTVGNVPTSVGQSVWACMQAVESDVSLFPPEEQDENLTMLRKSCLAAYSIDWYSEYQQEVINKFLGSLTAGAGAGDIIKMNIQTDVHLLDKARLTPAWPAATSNFLNLKSDNRQNVNEDVNFLKDLVQFEMNLGANHALKKKINTQISKINNKIALSTGQPETVSLKQFYTAIEEELGEEAADVIYDSTVYQSVKKSVKFLYWLDAQFNEGVRNNVDKKWLDGALRSIKETRQQLAP